MKILDALTEYILPLRKCSTSIKSPTIKCNYLFMTNNGDLPSMNEVNDMGLKCKKILPLRISIDGFSSMFCIEFIISDFSYIFHFKIVRRILKSEKIFFIKCRRRKKLVQFIKIRWYKVCKFKRGTSDIWFRKWAMSLLKLFFC